MEGVIIAIMINLNGNQTNWNVMGSIRVEAYFPILLADIATDHLTVMRSVNRSLNKSEA